MRIKITEYQIKWKMSMIFIDGWLKDLPKIEYVALISGWILRFNLISLGTMIRVIEL